MYDSDKLIMIESRGTKIGKEIVTSSINTPHISHSHTLHTAVIHINSCQFYSFTPTTLFTLTKQYYLYTQQTKQSYLDMSFYNSMPHVHIFNHTSLPLVHILIDKTMPLVQIIDKSMPLVHIICKSEALVHILTY